MTGTDYKFDRRPMERAGRVAVLSPMIRRVIAPNSFSMTFAGTSTYLVGRESVALIDPGPDDAEHVECVLAALDPGESIESILVTHRHVDHSQAVRRIQKSTGAPTYAFLPQPKQPDIQVKMLLQAFGGGGNGIDLDFKPDEVLGHEDCLTSSKTDSHGSPRWRIRALHTPGHLDDHLCFSLEADGALFTGDHVMGWSTTVILPPEGDLGEYMQSLEFLSERLRAGLDRTYYPAHGHPVPRPAALVAYLHHRKLEREKTILAVLGKGSLDFENLVKAVYTDITQPLEFAARRMLLAHLIHLCDRKVVSWSNEGNDSNRFDILDRETPSGSQMPS